MITHDALVIEQKNNNYATYFGNSITKKEKNINFDSILGLI